MLESLLTQANGYLAFKEETQRCPNYGKALGMDASHWWANVGTMEEELDLAY